MEGRSLCIVRMQVVEEEEEKVVEEEEEKEVEEQEEREVEPYYTL